MTPIAFALTPRMHAFIEMRDAIRCLNDATEHKAPYGWLIAAKKIQELLIGKNNRNPVVPNLLNLLSTMRKHFLQLAEKHPEFKDKLMQACLQLELSDESIRRQAPKAKDFLNSDALLTAYNQTTRQQDLIGHEFVLPQLIQTLWNGCEHANTLHNILEPITQAIEHLNKILHHHVPWEKRNAISGYDIIKLPAKNDIGLVIVGVPKTTIEQGIIPQCSSFRSSLRLRFLEWQPGKDAKNFLLDQNYALMMVPIL